MVTKSQDIGHMQRAYSLPILVVGGFVYHPKVGAHLRRLSELGTTTLNAYETLIDLCYKITFSRVFLRPTWNF
jgi:hypothetical protein